MKQQTDNALVNVKKYNAVIAAATKLLELKERKQQVGKDNTYRIEKPLAWDALQKALAMPDYIKGERDVGVVAENIYEWENGLQQMDETGYQSTVSYHFADEDLREEAKSQAQAVINALRHRKEGG